MEEPSPTKNEEEIDDQIRSMDSHKEYWSDLRADTGTLFLPGKIVMEQHSLTHSPSQSWSKETKSSGFEESVGDSTNDQNSAKMPEMWIANTNPGRRSTVMEPASVTPLNESKFSGEQTTVTTSSLNTMGTKRKHKGADDDRMQADDNINGVRPKAEAWRPLHSQYVQNTPSTEMISGSLLHDRSDEHHQLPDEFCCFQGIEDAEADGRSRWNTSSPSWTAVANRVVDGSPG